MDIEQQVKQMEEDAAKEGILDALNDMKNEFTRICDEELSVNLHEYTDVVNSTASDQMRDTEAMIERIKELQYEYKNICISKFINASMGLASEAGEFSEIAKKVVFQGKPLTEENVHHLKRELGDIMYYWAAACDALGLSPKDVIEENINKVTSRYPKGFEVDKSENRAANDL